MKKYFGLKKLLLFVFLLIVAVGSYLYFSRSNTPINDVEIESVTRNDVREVVSETGYVQPTRNVSMAFEQSGRVVSIPVKEGDVVEEGSLLVVLDSSERQANLVAAQARLSAEQVRLRELIAGADKTSLDVYSAAVDSSQTTLENAKVNLEEVISQQNQLVANAQKALLTVGLQAYLASDERESSSYSFTAPTISGTYNGTEEGVYLIELYNSDALSGSSYRVSGLETGTEEVSTINPTPIGTRGLYIQFPDDFAKRTTWEVSIPNTRSTSYQTYLNAYNAALDARDVAIETAKSAVKSAEAALVQTQQQYIQSASPARDEKIEAQRALVQQMQAAVLSAEIALDKTVLKAPFTGVITDITTEEGEIISPSVPLVSIIANDGFELRVDISESDIQEVTVGDQAIVSFDAYNNVTFTAEVVKIAPIATINEGVRVFEVTLYFLNRDSRIISGLSADIDIMAAERKDVIAIPSRAVVEQNNGTFVRTWDGEALDYLPVEVGLRGSDGMTEIVSGLSENMNIITFAREDTIAQLEANSQ